VQPLALIKSARDWLDDHGSIPVASSDDKVHRGGHPNDPEFNSYVEANELPPHRLLVLKRFFFRNYKATGKEAGPGG